MINSVALLASLGVIFGLGLVLAVFAWRGGFGGAKHWVSAVGLPVLTAQLFCELGAGAEIAASEAWLAPLLASAPCLLLGDLVAANRQMSVPRLWVLFAGVVLASYALFATLFWRVSS